MYILILLFWILTGITTGVVASDKGHGFGSWTLAGLLLGPLGLIAAVGLSDQKLREYIRRTIESESIRPIQNTQKLLDKNDLYVDSTPIPKLLSEGPGELAYQTKEYTREKYIDDFLLNKSASEEQLWMKIVEILEFYNPDIAALAERSKSNFNIDFTGGRAYVICKSDGQKIALAYAKESSNNDYYWQLKMY